MNNEEMNIESAFAEMRQKTQHLAKAHNLRAKNSQPANDELVALLTFWHRSPVPLEEFQHLMAEITDADITVAEAHHLAKVKDSSQTELLDVAARLIDYILEDEQATEALETGTRQTYGNVIKLLMHMANSKGQAA